MRSASAAIQAWAAVFSFSSMVNFAEKIGRLFPKDRRLVRVACFALQRDLIESDSGARDSLLASVELARCRVRLAGASVREIGGEQVAHYLRVVQVAIERLLRGHPHEAGSQEFAVRTLENETLDGVGILPTRLVRELAFLDQLLATLDMVRGRTNERRVVDLRDDDGLADEIAEAALVVAMLIGVAGVWNDCLPDQISSLFPHAWTGNRDTVAPVAFGALVSDRSLNRIIETARHFTGDVNLRAVLLERIVSSAHAAFLVPGGCLSGITRS